MEAEVGSVPLPQDFSIALSTSSVTLSQGDTSSPISVSLIPQNGFSGDVMITLSGIPNGISTNPTSPFSVSVSQPVSVIVGATFDASVGQFSVSAQATSGSLSHAATLALTIQQGVVTIRSRSTFVRTDSVAALDLSPRRPAPPPHGL